MSDLRSNFPMRGQCADEQYRNRKRLLCEAGDDDLQDLPDDEPEGYATPED